MRIIILNEKNEIAKTNEQGEICVIGTGVSLGYWNNPEITQKAFIQNPVNPYYEEKEFIVQAIWHMLMMKASLSTWEEWIIRLR